MAMVTPAIVVAASSGPSGMVATTAVVAPTHSRRHESISALPGLELGIFSGDQQRLGGSKSLDCGPLRLNAETGTLLVLS